MKLFGHHSSEMELIAHESDTDNGAESAEEESLPESVPKRKRWLSIFVLYFTMMNVIMSE